MEQRFWIDSWEEGGTKTSFHLREVHPHAAMLAERGLTEDARVLVPLCGKSVDLLYFAQHSRQVIGVELVSQAVVEFFSENAFTSVEESAGVYTAGNLTLFNFDLFDTGPATFGPIDLIYDRASLIAFPEDMRECYISKIIELSNPGTRYFINTLEYSPTMPTPPFSVGPEQIEDYYSEFFDIEHVCREVRPKHRMVEKFGLDYLIEHGFLLHRRWPGAEVGDDRFDARTGADPVEDRGLEK